MSRKVNIDSLSDHDLKKLSKDLQICQEPSKYAFSAKPTYICLYEAEGNDVYVPFAYSRKFARPRRCDFPIQTIHFRGRLRENQSEVKSEAIEHLNKYGSTIVSCYPGWGKCLEKDTPIIMYDGTVKMVQDIKAGEQLMGDDSTPRTVLNTCIGKEQMYKVIPIKGESFGCNETHILCLKISSHKVVIWDSNRSSHFVRWIDTKTMKNKTKYFHSLEAAVQFRDTIPDDDVVDISVKDYMALPQAIQGRLKLYHVPVEFPATKLEIEPYLLGLWLGDGTGRSTNITNVDVEIDTYLTVVAKRMGLEHKVSVRQDRAPTHRLVSDGRVGSNLFRNFLKDNNLLNNKHIPHSYKCNSRDNRLELLAGLIDSDGYLYENCYEICQKNKVLADDIVFLARSLGFTSYCKKVRKTCTNSANGRKTGTYYLMKIYGKGLEEIPVLLERKKAHPRQQIKDPTVSGFRLEPIQDDTYYGFVIDGNHRFLLGDFTVTHNTCLAIYIASKINMKTLIICHRIQLIKQWKDSILKFCPGATVQVITAQSKMKDVDFYVMNATNVPKHPRSFYKEIGFLAVDECHLIMAEKLSQCMRYVFPRYVLGLSATPYRTDGLDKMLEMYFGKRKIIRKLYRRHTIYKVVTGIKPEVKLNRMGKVDWGSVLESQSSNTARNEMIISLIKYFPDRVFLVLCKRVDQGNYLVQRLTEEGEDVTSLIGSNQEYEQKSRILVGTCQKVGVGFDHPRLDTLLLASDLEQYFVQYLGRVFRRTDVEPIIFDIVDSYGLLEKHFRTRNAVYVEHGGTVKDFARHFPKFKM